MPERAVPIALTRVSSSVWAMTFLKECAAILRMSRVVNRTLVCAPSTSKGQISSKINTWFARLNRKSVDQIEQFSCLKTLNRRLQWLTWATRTPKASYLASFARINFNGRRMLSMEILLSSKPFKCLIQHPFMSQLVSMASQWMKTWMRRSLPIVIKCKYGIQQSST